MKKSIIICCFLLIAIGGFAQSQKQYPEWVYKIRMVSIGHKPRKEKFNNGKNIEIILCDIAKINSLKMILPDFKEIKEFKAVYSKKSKGFVINIAPKEFGRHSIIVVDKEK